MKTLIKPCITTIVMPPPERLQGVAEGAVARVEEDVTMQDTLKLWLEVSYQDRIARIEYVGRESLIIGRKFLQTLFNLGGNSFLNISRRHLELFFDEKKEQFWAKDYSLLGTLARVVAPQSEDEDGPEFLYHHDQFAIKRQMRLRLLNENENRQPDDVTITIENQYYDETRPILHAPAYWDRLLKQLQTARVSHLIGLPGTGKSTLAKKLLSPLGDPWQRQRDGQLGGRTLVAWVDGRMINEHQEQLWISVGRRMLFALHTAADEQFLYDLRDEIQTALRNFDAQVTTIGQITPTFRHILRAVLRCGWRPMFVFDHFDAVLSQLDRFMLYQLAQIHQSAEVGEQLRYLLITRRPLDQLREDGKSNGVADFFQLFARHNVVMNCWQYEEFRTLWGQIAPAHRHLAPPILDELYLLSGGLPALVRELYEELAVNGWLDNPQLWYTHLSQCNWQSHPPQACTLIWEALSAEEQQAARQHAQEGVLSVRHDAAFRLMGLLRESGQWFSPLFDQMTASSPLQEPTQPASAEKIAPIPANGLQIDASRRRVYLDGQDITAKLLGRKLDVLLYMHRNARRVCDYDELIRHTLPENTAFDQVYFESERSALQRTVSRLCRLVDPHRQYIFNEQGQGYIFAGA